MYPERVVSGMRPTGSLHLGHYHGVLKNWISMQTEMPCLFFVADWHALATHFDDPSIIEKNTWDMLVDWLAAGVDPSQSTLFIQSKVLEHAELHLLLSMATPIDWLHSLPTYQMQQLHCQDRDFSTYGGLGYPLLQAADVLIYRASQVAVGADQVEHVDMMGDVARRFNHLYGKEAGFETHALEAVKKLGSKRAKLYNELRAEFQQQGLDASLDQAHALLNDAQNLSMIDRERLFGYLEGSRKLILVEPQVKLTATPCLLGLDGRKMSKSHGNSIGLREDKQLVSKKIRSMTTDPARVQQSDKGNPDHCPVWPLHQLYSDPGSQLGVRNGCLRGELSCVDCKQSLIGVIVKEQELMHERAQQYLDDPSLVRAIAADGCDTARKLAQETMRDVREAMGISYS